MKILISPFSARMPNGARNPKNWPHFDVLVQTLKSQGHEVIQIGVAGEDRIEGVDQFIQGWPLRKLAEVVRGVDTFVAVDNFFPHYCHAERLKGGVVVFSLSDPSIFGYKENTNLLKDPHYLRPYQFAPWWDVPYNLDAFVSPETVLEAVNERLQSIAA